jgi:PadR family transcriptional regulator, regulatory protein PadR
MARDQASGKRVELLQGTLDLLILRTLLTGPTHGHAIAKHIQRTSDDVLQVEHGSLYPALHRLERKGWISSAWQQATEQARPLKLYSLTPAGRKQLVAESSKWDTLVAAMGRVLKPT